MATFRFHLVGPAQPLEPEVPVGTIGELAEVITRQRFLEGRLAEPDDDGILLPMLIATSRIQCVVEVS